ncbi:hypothetical protein M6B38_120830 [Iris pallida]|uniref:Uncharacterized protein n=1 Tax=Iris pallida TaxID=29817 RepID=A0AAX6G0R3_IRIPA|nr:hypothetical protein M6B38_388740 [Iris pallida]KAJ6837437.1 hypothetical protein M6B38_120830 [Iris pallida]
MAELPPRRGRRAPSWRQSATSFPGDVITSPATSFQRRHARSLLPRRRSLSPAAVPLLLLRRWADHLPRCSSLQARRRHLKSSGVLI